MTTFNKLLIANRGEIAVRIARTARGLGYRTVAVYSDADAEALHVHTADEAVRIGGAAPQASYLDGEAIVAAARRTGAEAIHPGYGFLAENAEFARACVAAGLIFVGPPADAIELMGSKRRAKAAMALAGVPCIPGYHDEAQDDASLTAAARHIGFPLLIKASAGGGGRGMRRVAAEESLAEQLRRARSEARSAFGDDELILEKALDGARHIEIQVFADTHGNVVHLGERDCSVQRRHQKLIEESPSPFVDAGLRASMGKAAIRVARACDYVGAGTVEFLVDGEGRFYFMEMNTRLQVEHPVTELVTGQDLVAWQLAVASGEPLPLEQENIAIDGHAIEARLYAEDPRREFLPQTGTLHCWDYPVRDGIRVDHGVADGDTVGPHYDPLLAKVVAHGAGREEALRRLRSALQDTVLLGVDNNRAFLAGVCSDPVFAAGAATTSFVEGFCAARPGTCRAAPTDEDVGRAALSFYLRAQHAYPERSACRWRSAAGRIARFRLQCGDVTTGVEVREEESEYVTLTGDSRIAWRLLAHDGDDQLGLVTLERDGVRERVLYAAEGDRLYLDNDDGHRSFVQTAMQPAATRAATSDGRVVAPTDGAVVSVKVAAGDTVTAGQTIAVLEAMKMEHHLATQAAGVVGSVDIAVGEQVRAGQLVAVVHPETASPVDGDG